MIKTLPHIVSMIHGFILLPMVMGLYRTGALPPMPKDIITQIVGAVIGFVLLTAIQVHIDRKYNAEE